MLDQISLHYFHNAHHLIQRLSTILRQWDLPQMFALLMEPYANCLSCFL